MLTTKNDKKIVLTLKFFLFLITKIKEMMAKGKKIIIGKKPKLPNIAIAIKLISKSINSIKCSKNEKAIILIFLENLIILL
jgi:hypothetical protein